MNSLSDLEERVERLEKELKTLKRRLSRSGDVPNIIAEEKGVVLMESSSFFGGYDVIDVDGTVNSYADRKRAEEVFKMLVERAP